MLCLIYARGSSYMRENREKQKKLPLPSVFISALGKVSISRNRHFAECQGKNTRQRHRLCRVHFAWHSAKLGPCRVPVIGHSAKRSCLPSVFYLTLGKANSNWAGRFPLCCRVFFLFCRVLVDTQQNFAECPRKGTRQRLLRRQFVCRVLFAECYTRQRLCRVY